MKSLIQILLLVLSFQVCQAKGKTYILIHGAWHGACCWKKVVPLLEAEGNKVIAVDLPGHGADKSPVQNVSFNDYVNSVVEVVNAQHGPVILVGHSMGGVVIAQVAEVLGKEKIVSLIFLDAFMPDNGESVFSLAEKAERKNANSNITKSGPSLLESLIPSEDQKTTKLKAENVVALFYHDCSSEDVAFAQANLGWQPMACLGTPVHVTAARYGVIPKFFILCTKAGDLDKSSLVNNVICQKVFTLESSHSPFFSMPEQLAKIINGI